MGCEDGGGGGVRRWVSGVRVAFITESCRVDRRCEPSKSDKYLSQTHPKREVTVSGVDVCVYVSLSCTQGDSQPFQQTIFDIFLFWVASALHCFGVMHLFRNLLLGLHLNSYFHFNLFPSDKTNSSVLLLHLC